MGFKNISDHKKVTNSVRQWKGVASVYILRHHAVDCLHFYARGLHGTSPDFLKSLLTEVFSYFHFMQNATFLPHPTLFFLIAFIPPDLF